MPRKQKLRKKKSSVWIPKSGRTWKAWDENIFFSFEGTEEEKQRIVREKEVKYYQLLQPHYRALSEEESARADLLIVISLDTRFGRPRIDKTRLSVWDILGHWEDPDTNWAWIASYKTPILTEKNIRDAISVWFIKRWMNAKVPIVSRFGMTQKEIADLLPVDLRPQYESVPTKEGNSNVTAEQLSS